jgi:hypothetical protein
MKSFLRTSARILLLVCVLAVAAGWLHVERGGSADAGAPASAGKTTSPARGGITTLYARDPITRTLCFNDGQGGHVFQEGEVRNRCSHLDFSAYAADGFSVGVQGGNVGRIVDLGTADELQRRYGYSETVGKGQGFASLGARGGKVFVLKGSHRDGAAQEVAEAGPLFGPERRGEAMQSAPVRAGHIYLVRLTDRHEPSFELAVKLLVLAHAPGESVTIRWQTL